MIKNLFKAIGFTVVIAMIYLLMNFIAFFLFGIGDMVFNGGMNALTNVEDLTEYLYLVTIKYALYTTILGNLLTLGALVLIINENKGKFTSYVAFRKNKSKDIGLLLLFGLLLNFIISPILSYLVPYLPSQAVDTYGEVMEMLLGNNTSIIIMVLTTSIVAPIFEEVIFRGIIFKEFKRSLPIWLANIIQAVLFGVIHGNIIQGSYAFLLGIILGIAYQRYKTIWAPIAMHFAFNTTSVLISLVFSNAEENSLLISMLVIGVIGIIPVSYVLYKRYDREFYRSLSI